MTLKQHVVITGTGRAGTTFLVELLTNLGLDTGFKKNDLIILKNKMGRAGLEHDIRKANCPYIVKSPWFCDYAHEVFNNKSITIEHIFLPMRDLNAAAESRRFVTRNNIIKHSTLSMLLKKTDKQQYAGGLWHTNSLKTGKQEQILQFQLYKLLLEASSTFIPITILQYPRIVKDCDYLYAKLKPILNNISIEFFSQVFIQTVNPELVHSFNQNDC